MSTETSAPPPSGPAGFLRALFDLSFRELVTPRIIRILYVLWLAITALILLLIAIQIFDGDEVARVTFDGRIARVDDGGNAGGGILFLLIGCPLLFLLSAILGRVQLELVMALFRVAENTGAMREAVGAGAPGAPPGSGFGSGSGPGPGPGSGTRSPTPTPAPSPASPPPAAPRDEPSAAPGTDRGASGGGLWGSGTDDAEDDRPAPPAV
jgi:hypothetical protein